MSVKKDFLSGLFYTAAARYSGIIISLIVSSILARLLTPKEFGVVGVATVLIAFFNILGDIGIGPAIIQNQNLSKRDIQSIHAFTTYVGLSLSVIFFIASGPIANFYGDQALVGICRWLSVTIAFTCWGIVPLNLHYKEKSFRKIALITLLVQILSGFGACLYAFYGGGVYSLVLQSVVSSLFLSLTYNFMAKLDWEFSVTRESLQKIKTFSSYQFFFNIINYCSRNSDKLLIGRYINLTQLGYYEKSYRLMMLPLQNITFVISPVLLPIFASFQDDLKQLTEKYLKLLNPLAYLAFPLSILLYFCAPEIVLIIFGNQWIDSIKPFQILSFTVGFQIIISTTGGVFQAIGQTKRMFYSGCWGAFFVITSFIISIFGWHTIEAVCYGYLIAQIANEIQCFHSLFTALGYNPLSYFKSLIRPISISALIFFIMWIQSTFFPISNIWYSLITKGGIGVLSSLLLVNTLSPYNLINIIKARSI